MSGFPESLLSGSSVTFCHASFGPCQLAPWHGITLDYLSHIMGPPRPPPVLSLFLFLTNTHPHSVCHAFLVFLLLSHPPFTLHSEPHAVYLFKPPATGCPSSPADQLCAATGGGKEGSRRVYDVICVGELRGCWRLPLNVRDVRISSRWAQTGTAAKGQACQNRDVSY